MPHAPILNNLLAFNDLNIAFMFFHMNQQQKMFLVDYYSTTSLLLTQLWFQEKYDFSGSTMQKYF